jgi:hypothetical protein
MDALLFLSRVLGACKNKPVFVVEGGPWYSWAFRELGLQYYRGAFGDRSGVERFFGSLKRRTRVFFNNINAGRSRIASLDMLMNLFFVYYNGLRFHKGIRARAVGGDPPYLTNTPLNPRKVKAGQAPRARVGLREVLPALIVLMVAAWALFISAVFVLAAAVIPLEITGPRIIYVELQVAKGVAGAVILAAWIYSYLRLRDVVARFLLTPRQRASDRTPP